MARRKRRKPRDDERQPAPWRERAASVATALDNRRKTLAVAVFAVALALRLLFIFETHDLPQLRTPTPGLDIQVNWEAARALRGQTANEPSFELMMLSAPLYPYWLAANQAVIGESMLTHRIVSALFGSLRMALLFFIFLFLSKRAWAALTSSLLLVALPSLIYFDTVLIKAATDLTLLTLLLAALFAWERPASGAATVVRAIVCAGLLAGAFLSQLNTFLYVFPVVAFVAANRSWPRAKRALFALGTLAVVGGVFGAYQLRSPDQSGDDARFVPRAGVDLHIGFHPGATGVYSMVPGISPWPSGHAFEARMLAEVTTAKRMTWRDSDLHFRKKALSFVREHPGTAARLVLRKVGHFVNNYEVRGTDYLYYLDDYSRVLRWSPVCFGWLLILGAIGFFALVSERRWRPLVLLGGIAFCVLLANCLAIVEWRFRLPVTVLFAAVGAPGLVHVVRMIGSNRAQTARRRYYLRLGGLTLLVLIASWLAFRTTLQPQHARYVERAAENHNISKLAERKVGELADLERRLEANPEDAAVREERAKLLSELRRHSEAYAALRALTAAGQGGEWAQKQFMRYLLWLGRYEEASRYLEKQRRTRSAFYTAIRERSGWLEGSVIDMFILPEQLRATKPRKL